MSTANPSPAPKTIRKLHKPPTVATIHTPRERPERPRKRLQKRHTAPTLRTQQQHQLQQQQDRDNALFLLEYEPYPPTAHKTEILGVYSSIDAVTKGAFKHGAYAFSKEGVVDGSEYLSPSGRIKMRRVGVQSVGAVAAIPEKTVLPSGEPVRLDIPHPTAFIPGPPATTSTADSATGGVDGAAQKEVVKGKGREVFLAVHETTDSVFCVGIFTTKPLAWGACLKDKAWLAWSDVLEDEESRVGEGNCPEVSVRVKGSARQEWYVRIGEVDAHVPRKAGDGGITADQGGVEEVRKILEGVPMFEGVPVDVARFEITRKERPGVGRAATDLQVGVRDV